MAFNPEKFKQKLTASVYGRTFIYLPEVDSTNNYLAANAALCSQPGTVVLTDFQTSGRGRADHRWVSRRGENLLFSILIQPAIPAARLQLLTLQAGLALHQTLSEVLQECGADAAALRLKWPNDLLLAGKKLGGILTETQTQSGLVRQAIIGIGLNINQSFTGSTEKYSFNAISLIDYIGRAFEREELLAHILTGLENSALHSGNWTQISRDWQERAVDIQSPWNIFTEGRHEQVYFHSIDDYGYLNYKTAAGEIKTLINGEVVKG